MSDGVVVETSVLARLLGIKLLTVEGIIVLSPAQVRAARPVGWTPDGPQLPAGFNGGSGGRRQRETMRSPRATPEAERAVGASLATAEQLLAECADTLRLLDE